MSSCCLLLPIGEQIKTAKTQCYFVIHKMLINSCIEPTELLTFLGRVKYFVTYHNSHGMGFNPEEVII